MLSVAQNCGSALYATKAGEEAICLMAVHPRKLIFEEAAAWLSLTMTLSWSNTWMRYCSAATRAASINLRASPGFLYSKLFLKRVLLVSLFMFCTTSE